jgi:hypothetical protein
MRSGFAEHLLAAENPEFESGHVVSVLKQWFTVGLIE